MRDSATDAFDAHDEEQIQRRLAMFLDTKLGRQRLEELTKKARWALHSVQRIGLDEEDAVYSAVRTALRREGIPSKAPAPEEDIWGWFERLFWKRCAKYRKRQTTDKHGWHLESDHFTQDESGTVALPDTRPNAILDEDDVEGHIRHVLGLINSELFDDEQRALAGLLVRGFTPKEIAEMYGVTADTIRRRIRKLRGKIDPQYQEKKNNEKTGPEDGDGPINIPDLN